jgi:hypothetical protein
LAVQQSNVVSKKKFFMKSIFNRQSKNVLIREISTMDPYHRNFIINQANNVYLCPLLPIVIKTEYLANSKT